MDKMAMSPKGIKLLLAGVIVIAAGFILMMGGGTSDPQVFNWDMFDFRRTVAAPIVVLCGVVVCMVAILGKRTRKEDE